MASCRKDQNNQFASLLKVESIQPNYGTPGTVITIKGIGFDGLDKSKNTILVDGVQATIQDATESVIHAIVPNSSHEGPVNISMASNGKTTSSFLFNLSQQAYKVRTTLLTNQSYFVSAASGYQPINTMVDNIDGSIYAIETNIYANNVGLNGILRIDTNGRVSVFAGNNSDGKVIDGVGSAASFNFPRSMTRDKFGNLYLLDYVIGTQFPPYTPARYVIRKITPSAVVTTLPYILPFNNAPLPPSITCDIAGNFYLTINNFTVGSSIPGPKLTGIIKISTSGTISTFAGKDSAGYADGIGTRALFNEISSITIDGIGNLYVLDYNKYGYYFIRKITPTGTVTTYAGSENANNYLVNDGPAAQATFGNQQLTLMANTAGTLFILSHPERIRKVNLTRGGVGGLVSTIAGNGLVGYADGIGSNAQFYNPAGFAFLKKNLYTIDIDPNLTPNPFTLRTITP